MNYRGSSGKGDAFSRAIVADWGHKEVEDLMAGVDALIQQGITDPAKLGIGGWSYGGMLTDYTIGSKWQQAYATTLPNGQIHVFPIQYSTVAKQWLNYWKIIDSPGSERADPNSWQKHDGSTSYQLNCAVCHTSQLRNTLGALAASSHRADRVGLKAAFLPDHAGEKLQRQVGRPRRRFDHQAHRLARIAFARCFRRFLQRDRQFLDARPGEAADRRCRRRIVSGRR